jgi:hypothetical protein
VSIGGWIATSGWFWRSGWAAAVDGTTPDTCLNGLAANSISAKKNAIRVLHQCRPRDERIGGSRENRQAVAAL